MEVEFTHDGDGSAIFDVELLSIDQDNGQVKINIGGKVHCIKLNDKQSVTVDDCHANKNQEYDTNPFQKLFHNALYMWFTKPRSH